MEELKAISSIDHPLCYPVFLERQRKNFSGPPHMNGSTPLQKNGVSPSGSLSTLVSPRSIEDKALYTYERQRIVDLCNAYAYTLDSTMMDLGIAEDWANLFTDDCVVTYPFGTHHGKASLAKFGMKAESRFKRMVHVSTNITVIFESNDIAHARYTCFATHGTHGTDLSQHFMEGGYYYSSFRRVTTDGGDQWKFSHLTLDMMWEMGESLGLNEPHEPEEV